MRLSVAGIGVLALVVLLVLCACGVPHTEVSAESPRVCGKELLAGSDLTESSQFVEVRLEFDKSVEAKGSLDGSFEWMLNGKAIDAATIQQEAFLKDGELVLRLVPTAAADGSSASKYFALYGAEAQVRAVGEQGAIPNLVDASGNSNAVLDGDLSFIVPSGVKLDVVEVRDEDTASGRHARIVFDVVDFAQLRACTWLSFSDGGQPVMMHNHEFLRDTPRTCAERLAATINTNYSDSYSAAVDGATITVDFMRASDGFMPELCLIEGFDASTGAAPVASMGSEAA